MRFVVHDLHIARLLDLLDIASGLVRAAARKCAITLYPPRPFLRPSTHRKSFAHHHELGFPSFDRRSYALGLA
jgi:hypothetical protein